MCFFDNQQVASADTDIKNKVQRLFDLKNVNVDEIKKLVGEYINSVGDAMSEEDKEKERKHLNSITNGF